MSKPSSKQTRQKRKRQKGRARKEFDEDATSGGAMQSMVGGFKAAVGVGDGKKPSKVLDRLLWAAVIAAAIGVFVYRCT